MFLFPRQQDSVEWAERELRVYRALEPAGLTLVPRVRNQWRDDAVYPFPFAEVTRLAGQRPADPAGLFDQLGRALARCHMITPPELPGARPPAHQQQPHMHWLRRALDPSASGDAAAEAAGLLGRPDRLPVWRERLGAAARLEHVLVHGDVHEDQLLACDGRLTGILDWETARVDHPFWDFDLGEWGTGLWRRRRAEFSRLWSTPGVPTRSSAASTPTPRPLETAFRLRQALYLQRAHRDPAVTGTVTEHVALA